MYELAEFENMAELNFFHKLLQEEPFNVFVGAGISKPAPTCAPLWNEMFRDFIEAMFERMGHENWPAASAFATDKLRLLSFDFKPETFWELIAAQTSYDLVWKVLKVVNNGAPNLNHRLISLLASRGIIRNIITTNFDEHIDHCLSSVMRPLITRNQIQQAAIEASNNQGLSSCYFKVHGTVSMPETLQFTLAHTLRLPAEKAKCLEACLSDLPLLIAGYSGNDNDTRPLLFNIARRIPKVVLVMHPGSRSDEPIMELINLGSNVTLEKADITSVFLHWVKDMASKDPEIAALLYEPQTVTTSPKAHYVNAIESCPVALIPFIISNLFSFSGDYYAALRYAHLCEDACEDSRYVNDLPEGLLGRAFLQLSQCYGSIGQVDMSRMFAEFATKEITEKIGFITGGIECSLSRGLSLLLNNELKEAEFWIVGAYSMVNLGLEFNMATARQKFLSCWYLGRLRARQGRLSEAVAAYQEAGIPKDDILSYTELGAFILDYGCALMKYGAETGDGSAFEDAGRMFALAEAVARRTGDHVILIKALMNLAKGNYMGGAIDIARRQIQEAQELAIKIGDSSLRDRVAQLKTIICGKYETCSIKGGDYLSFFDSYE